MKRAIFLLCAFFALAGCKGLKEQQLGAYVGDSQTKVLYKNVGKFTTIVPDGRRVYFRSVEQATDAGYTSASDSTPKMSEDGS